MYDILFLFYAAYLARMPRPVFRFTDPGAEPRGALFWLSAFV